MRNEIVNSSTIHLKQILMIIIFTIPSWAFVNYDCQSDYNCEQCYDIAGPNINKGNCLQCKGGYFLKDQQDSPGVNYQYCTNNCGRGYYPYEDNLNQDRLQYYIRKCIQCFVSSTTSQCYYSSGNVVFLAGEHAKFVIKLSLFQTQKPNKYLYQSASLITQSDCQNNKIGYAFQDSENYVCFECYPGASSCTSLINQVTCKSNFQKLGNMCYEKVSLVQTAIKEYYKFDIGSNTYIKLDVGVYYYDNASSKVICLPNFNFLNSNQCIQNCPKNKEEDTSIPSTPKCIDKYYSCNNPQFLNPYAQVCIPSIQSCPIDQYKRSIYSVCQKCDDGLCQASSCNGDIETCTSCKTNIGTSTLKIFLNYNSDNNKCLIECPPQYYLSGNNCLLCSSVLTDCNTCLSNTVCNSCKSPKVLQNGQCVAASVCGDPYQAVNLGTDLGIACTKCREYVLKCDNTGKETQCSALYTLNVDLNKCILFCDPNQHEISNACQKINPIDDCQKFSYDTLTDCQLCKQGFHLKPDKTCQSTCVTPGQSIDNDQTCNPSLFYDPQCTSYSLQAIDSKLTFVCQGCSEKIYGSKFKCISSSLSSKPFMFDILNQISQCSSECKVCSTSKTTCSSCFSPFLLQGSKCLLKCDTTHYQDASGQNCIPCPSPCDTCYFNRQDSKIKCISCITSSPDYFLDQKSFQCSQSCQAGYYGDAGTKVCKTCHHSCLTCQNTATQCIDCAQGYYKKGSVCVEDCGDGFFLDKSTGLPYQCVDCSIILDCNLCAQDDGTFVNQCIQCKPNYLFDITDPNPSQYKCIPEASCTNTKYPNEQFCISCKKPCASCSNQSTCTSCITGFSLSSGKCVLQCPLKQYSNGGVCVPCDDANCKVCKEQNKCQQCSQGYEIVNFICKLQGNQCLSTEYYEPHSQTCVNCLTAGSGLGSTGCKECSLQSDQLQCTKCDTGYFLYKSACLKQCPPNTYQDTDKCSQCKGQCNQCDNNGICNFDCLPSFYHLDQGSNDLCLTQCNSNQYYQNTIGYLECMNCNQNICNLQSPFDLTTNKISMLSCGTGYLSKSVSSYIFTCSQVSPYCIKGEKLDNLNRKCLKCPQEYASCDSTVAPIECKLGYFLQNDGNCVTQCMKGYYEYNKECKSCKVGCERCYYDTSSTDIICTICYTGYFYDETNLSNRCQLKTQTSQCSTSFYLDVTTNICKPCHPNCKKCSGGLDTDCQTCFGSLILKTENSVTKCVSQCGDGYYSESQVCKTCPTECSQCSSLNLCTQCKDNTYFLQVQYITDVNGVITQYNMACIKNINSCTLVDQYIYKNVCRKCQFPCLECGPPSLFANTENNCVRCDSNYFLYNGQCVLNCPYDLGYFYDKSDPTKNKCKHCISNCKTCSDFDYKCLQCNSGFFLDIKTNTCVTDCDKGYFKNTSNNTCQDCQAPCSSKCSGLIDMCNECDPGFKTFSDGTGQYVKCLKECPESYYFYNNKCTKCVTGNCNYCSVDTGKNCKKCNNSYGLVVSINANTQDYEAECKIQCLNPSNCPNSYSFITNLFSQSTYSWPWFYTCQAPCMKCYGSLNQKCLSCLDGYYLSSDQCLKCNPECRKCNSKTSCTECTLGFFLESNKCVPSCLNTTYGSNTSKKCEACDGLKCQQCQINSYDSSDNCTLCDNQGYLFKQENQCRTDNIDGFFTTTVNPLGKIYQMCHQYCKKCSGTGDNCTECKEGYYLYNKKCYTWDTCPSGTYASDFGNPKQECKPCPNSTNCAECFGKEPDNIYCKKCRPNFLLNHDSTCKSTCDYGLIDLVNRKCLGETSCKSTCLVCKDTNTCESCKKGFFLNEAKQCVKYCDKGFYEDVQKRSCERCNTACTSCFGGGPTNCRECSQSYFLQDPTTCTTSCSCITPDCKSIKYYEQRICVKECPIGTFKYTKNGESTCYENCFSNDQDLKMYGFFQLNNDLNISECITKDQCKAKNTNGQIYNYVIDDQQKQCYKGKCPEFFYEDIDNVCVPNCSNMYFNNPFTRKCVQQCESSDSASNSYKNLWGFQQDSNTRICVLNCPDGYYKSIEDRMCLNNCTSKYPFKQEDKKECVESCSPPLYNLFENKMCYQQCPQLKGIKYYGDKQNPSYPNKYVCVTEDRCSSKTYPNFITQQCDDCHIYCNKCDGPTKEQCSLCKDQYVFLPPSSCREYCPRGYFQSNNNECQKCPTGCSSCTQDSCNQCKIDYFYLDGKCYNKCPDGKYGETVSGVAICLPCHSDCLTCDGGLSSSCLTCSNQGQADQKFYLQLGRCIKECTQEGFYQDNTLMKCLTCPEYCINCTNSQSCTSCRTDTYFWKDQGSCHLKCPSPSVGNSQTKECVKNCDKGMWADPETRICIPQCRDPLWANEKSTECLQDCPDGTYKSYTNRICISCNEACDQCTGALLNECTKCALGYYKDEDDKNSLCTKTCADGKYKNNYTRTCQKYFDYELLKIKDDVSRDVFKLQFNYGVSQENFNKLVELNIKKGIQGQDYNLSITKYDTAGMEYLIEVQYLKKYPKDELTVKLLDQSSNSLNQENPILLPSRSNLEVADLYGKPLIGENIDENQKYPILILALLFLAFCLFNSIFDSINYISWNFIYSLQVVCLLKYSALNLHESTYTLVDYISQVVFIEFIPKGFKKLLNGYFEFYNSITINDQQPPDSFYLRGVPASFFMNALNYIYYILFFSFLTGFIYFFSGGFSIEEDPQVLMKYRRIRYFFHARQILVRVNEVLFLPIMIFVLLQLQTTSVSNAFNSLSFVFSLISILYYSLFLYKSIRSTLYYASYDEDSYFMIKLYYDPINGDKEKSPFYKGCFIFIEYSLKLIMAFSIVFLSDIPYAQVGVILGTIVVHFLLLIWLRPYLNLFQNITVITGNCLVLVVYVTAFLQKKFFNDYSADAQSSYLDQYNQTNKASLGLIWMVIISFIAGAVIQKVIEFIRFKNDNDDQWTQIAKQRFQLTFWKKSKDIISYDNYRYNDEDKQNEDQSEQQNQVNVMKSPYVEPIQNQSFYEDNSSNNINKGNISKKTNNLKEDPLNTNRISNPLLNGSFDLVRPTIKLQKSRQVLDVEGSIFDRNPYGKQNLNPTILQEFNNSQYLDTLPNYSKREETLNQKDYVSRPFGEQSNSRQSSEKELKKQTTQEKNKDEL